MFASRSAFPALRAARGQLNRSARSYATPPPAPQGGSSNLPLVLGLAGVAGLGYYVYLQRSGLGAGSDKLWAVSHPGNAGISSDAWTPVKLKSVETLSDNTHHLKFEFTGEGASEKTSGLTVASCLIVRSPEVKDEKNKPVIRPYTPVSPPGQKGGLDLVVKSYATGLMSKHMGEIKPGDEILMKGPIMKFEYKPNAAQKALFVAGGSGITPAWQLINHAMALPEDKTKFTLLFANVSEKDILLRKEWEALAARHPDRLKVVFFLDNAPEGWAGETGYVSKEKIQHYFPRAEGDKVNAFICGPPGQYKAISGEKAGKDQGELGGVFKELGFTKEEVFKF